MALTSDSLGSDVRLSGADVEDYLALLKPRVMSLVIFTALVGLVVAPGTLHPFLSLVAILSIAVGAGASAALNMWYDADIDRIMSRTRSRPIPSGRVTPEEALVFGLVLSVFSVMTLGIAVNWFAAGLLAFTIFFYAVVYTMWLKRSTPQNIVIGGASGALPPVIGWASVTGSVSLEPLVLFLIIFMWTPPHFWALALWRETDYGRAGVPMMPNVKGVDATRLQILLYALVLAPLGVLPAFLGFGGLTYGVIAAIGGALFVALAVKIYRAGEERAMIQAAKQLFAYSILYLFVLFAVLLLETLVPAVGGLF